MHRKCYQGQQDDIIRIEFISLPPELLSSLLWALLVLCGACSQFGSGCSVLCSRTLTHATNLSGSPHMSFHPDTSKAAQLSLRMWHSAKSRQRLWCLPSEDEQRIPSSIVGGCCPPQEVCTSCGCTSDVWQYALGTWMLVPYTTQQTPAFISYTALFLTAHTLFLFSFPIYSISSHFCPEDRRASCQGQVPRRVMVNGSLMKCWLTVLKTHIVHFASHLTQWKACLANRTQLHLIM